MTVALALIGAAGRGREKIVLHRTADGLARILCFPRSQDIRSPRNPAKG
jgi:hypothetical protein